MELLLALSVMSGCFLAGFVLHDRIESHLKQAFEQLVDKL